MSNKPLRYRIGIDVGSNSEGLVAIEIDDSDDNPSAAMPLRFLSIMSVLHDGGIDPSEAKYNNSRKAVSGTARRIRRMHDRRRKRYQELDVLLGSLHYPVAQACEMAAGIKSDNPRFLESSYLPWRARLELVKNYIENDLERRLYIAIALRHIARHRGWRNPYSSVSTLAVEAQTASSFYLEFFYKLQKWRLEKGIDFFPGVRAEKNAEGLIDIRGVPDWEVDGSERPTIAQLVEPLLEPLTEYAFRKPAQAGKGGQSKKHSEDAGEETDEHGASENEGKEGREEKEAGKREVSAYVGKLHQSDNYYEILRIFSMQKVPAEEREQLLNAVFYSISPKDVGAAANLVGKDDIQPTRRRASKASLAFQRYRILTTLANLRIKKGGEARRLSDEERIGLYEHLTSRSTSKKASDLTWHDVAEHLGVEYGELKGVGGQTADGEPISMKQPPCLTTEFAILSIAGINNKLKLLKDWWESADELSKEFFIEFLGNAGMPKSNLDEDETQAIARMEDFISTLGELSEESLDALEKVKLASGRAAYSVNTLVRLNGRMLHEGLDLFEARKAEFGLEDDWRPTPQPLGTPTGHPAADRTIKIVARWLKACERKWGKPETINIEHVRDGFKSEKQRQREQHEMDKRFKNNNEVREAIRNEINKALDEGLGSGCVGAEAVSHAQIRKWQAIQRQQGKCLYCGSPITLQTAQMDHIVPRKGPGSSSVLANLVAICEDCNRSKNNTLFSKWASKRTMEETIERVDQWLCDGYFTKSQFKAFKKDVKARLKRKEEDEPLDSRSIESVAWMARELRDQIAGHFGYKDSAFDESAGQEPASLQNVRVYKGWITAEARKASGLENALPWLGSYQRKTRLDRRHHAVDAAVIALLRQGVAQVLLEREALHRESRDREDQGATRGFKKWKDHQGSDERDTDVYLHWKNSQMERLRDMLIKAMSSDAIVVTHPLRLRLGVGQAHSETIYPLLKLKVGSALSLAAIDKAETPALWTALTNHKDFNEASGLKKDESREIHVHGRQYGADDEIGFMAKKGEIDQVKPAVYKKMRGGYAGIGNTIHHARFYRLPKLNSRDVQTGWSFALLRVFQTDLVRHSKDNLFEVELPLRSISVRSAVPDLRAAFKKGTAEYLGWAVVDDEVVIDPTTKLFSPDGPNKINKLLRAFPLLRRLRILGFSTNSKMTLAPYVLSEEGLPPADSLTPAQKIRIFGNHLWEKGDIEKIVIAISQGCPLAVNEVLSTYPAFIRRNALGRERWKSNGRMPLCWKVPPHPDI